MTKELPVGVTKSKHGYRLYRTVGGKKYNFGSIQNTELALRTNGYIDIIVNDLIKAQSKSGSLSVQQLHEMIVENSISDMLEFTNLIDESNRNFNHKWLQLVEQNKYLIEANEKLNKKLDAIVSVIQLEGKKSAWQRIKGS